MINRFRLAITLAASWASLILGAVCCALFAIGHLLGVATSGTFWYLAFGVVFLVLGATLVYQHGRECSRRRQRGA